MPEKLLHLIIFLCDPHVHLKIPSSINCCGRFMILYLIALVLLHYPRISEPHNKFYLELHDKGKIVSHLIIKLVQQF
jgi:hypothetical protein